MSPDEKARCQDVLESLLPRESKSKEVGAALLPVVLYPAFALSNSDIVTKTLAVIDQKLQGKILKITRNSNFEEIRRHFELF